MIEKPNSFIAGIDNRFPRLATLLTAALLTAIILIVYWPATGNGFVWDDWQYLFNIEYNSPEYWERALKAPLLFSKNYYRPVPVASFLAENYFYGGPSAAAMHLTNILLHAFNTVLVALLAFRLGVHLRAAPGRARLLAFFVALVYGLHPANIETVTWISGRFDLLLTAFLLLALLANVVVRHRVARPLLVGAAFFAAAATKESAVVFPFVLFAWNMAWTPRPMLPLRQFFADTKKHGELAVYGSIVLAGLAYLALRKWSLGYVYVMDATANTGSGVLLIQKVLLTAEALGRYLFLAIYPYAGLSVTHPHKIPVALNDTLAWVSLAAIVGLVAVLVIAIRHRPTAGWLWASLPVALLPVLHILPMTIGDNIIHERYLTYPLTLLALAITATAIAMARPGTSFSESSMKAKKAGMATLLAVVLILNVINIRVTVPLWHEDWTLWRWAVAVTPDSVMARGNLGNSYLVRHDFPEALKQGLKAVELGPGTYIGWAIAGSALTEMGEKEAGLAYLKAGIAISASSSIKLHIVFSQALMGLGRYSEAEEILTAVAQKDPLNREVNMLLGIVYHRLGQSGRADQYFEKSVLLYSPQRKALQENTFKQMLANYGSFPRPMAK